MNAPLRRRQVLGLGLAGLGTAVVGPALRGRAERSSAHARPAVPSRRAAGGRVADLELVAQVSPGTLSGGPAELLTYNGRSPGPLLELNAGDQVRLRLHNRLPQPTNLHFHGLHIPPTGSADNVFLSVPPGGFATYSFTIARDHPAGLFYIHPHHHHLTADQVFGGLGGALVVRGDLDRIPEVAAAAEAVLVLKDFASPDGQGDAGMGMGMGMGRGMERMLGREGPLLTVNGELNPGLSIPSGGLLRLRLLNASNARIYRLSLEGHRLVLIATDGGAIPSPESLEELLLAPGERADLLVQGNQTPGTYRLLDLPYQRSGHGGMGPMAPVPSGPRTLATLRYAGAVTPLPLPTALLPVPALPEPERTRRFVLTHGMGGMGMGGMGMGMGMGGMGMGFLINGQAFDPGRIDTRVRLGSTEDWLLVNEDVMDHPFHLHINPFQVISRAGRPEVQRRWKDTVLVRAGEEVRIRVSFRDFPGRTVYHCHNLDHEDMGMMGMLQIDGHA